MNETIVHVDLTVTVPPALPVVELISVADIKSNSRTKKLMERMSREKKIALLVINKLPNWRRVKRWKSDRLAIFYGDVPDDQLGSMGAQIKEQIEAVSFERKLGVL